MKKRPTQTKIDTHPLKDEILKRLRSDERVQDIYDYLKKYSEEKDDPELYIGIATLYKERDKDKKKRYRARVLQSGGNFDDATQVEEIIAQINLLKRMAREQYSQGNAKDGRQCWDTIIKLYDVKEKIEQREKGQDTFFSLIKLAFDEARDEIIEELRRQGDYSGELPTGEIHTKTD